MFYIIILFNITNILPNVIYKRQRFLWHTSVRFLVLSWMYIVEIVILKKNSIVILALFTKISLSVPIYGSLEDPTQRIFNSLNYLQDHFARQMNLRLCNDLRGFREGMSIKTLITTQWEVTGNSWPVIRLRRVTGSARATVSIQPWVCYLPCTSIAYPSAVLSLHYTYSAV